MRTTSTRGQIIVKFTSKLTKKQLYAVPNKTNETHIGTLLFPLDTLNQWIRKNLEYYLHWYNAVLFHFSAFLVTSRKSRYTETCTTDCCHVPPKEPSPLLWHPLQWWCCCYFQWRLIDSESSNLVPSFLCIQFCTAVSICSQLVCCVQTCYCRSHWSYKLVLWKLLRINITFDG